MREGRRELQAAIWNMITQTSSIPDQIETLRKDKNVAVIQPDEELPMWRIDPRIDRLRRTIKQGYEDTLNHPGLTNFFGS